MNGDAHGWTSGVAPTPEGQVRVVGTYEIPWFCGRDVCTILGYKDIKDALQKHVLPHQKKSLSLLGSELSCITHDNLLGTNNLSNEYHEGKAVYINQQGLRSLLAKSNLN